MTAAELSRLAPPGDPAWNERVIDIGAAAVSLAWAARPADVNWHGLDSPRAYFVRLSGAERAAWFVLAFRAATGEGATP